MLIKARLFPPWEVATVWIPLCWLTPAWHGDMDSHHSPVSARPGNLKFLIHPTVGASAGLQTTHESCSGCMTWQQLMDGSPHSSLSCLKNPQPGPSAPGLVSPGTGGSQVTSWTCSWHTVLEGSHQVLLLIHQWVKCNGISPHELAQILLLASQQCTNLGLINMEP